MNKTLLVVIAVILSSCATSPEPKLVEVTLKAPVQVPVSASAAPAAPEEKAEPESKPSAPAAATAAIAPFEQSVWKLKKDKLLSGQPAPKLLSQMKNQKTPGVTTEKCWNYQKFAVVEMKSTDEIGAAEVGLRTATEEHKNLCAKEFKGPTKDLKIIEGHFVGVIGDYVLLDGDDSSEGTLEFQVFDLSGKQIFKGNRHPSEDFTIIAKGGKTSLTFFTKIQVRCELAEEGEECWKKTLAANKVPATPMPDCKGAFAKSKTVLTESALVTVKAHIADLANPRVKFLGGQATCAPAP